jgi:hypothetical protein
MTLKLNEEAVEFARSLIDERKYRINTVWSVVEPSDRQAGQMLAQAGWEDFANWYLAVDPEEDGIGAVRYPFGDFRSVHRSGLLDVRQQAELRGEQDIAEAARELVDWIDHFNAC